MGEKEGDDMIYHSEEYNEEEEEDADEDSMGLLP